GTAFAVDAAFSAAPGSGRASSPPRTFGHLEHAEALDRFFAKLAELEAGRATTDVRVVQYCDSHTASDYGTSVVRAKLTARFGDGGRGFIPIGEPYKRLFQVGELTSSGLDFHPEEGRSVQGGTGKRPGDGLYGPWGIGMAANRAQA